MHKWTEQRIFVYIALIVGALFIFITPPFQSPDENSHFMKSYQIANGHLYPVVRDGEKGNYFPKEMINYIDEKTAYRDDLDKKYSYEEMYNEQYASLNYDEKEFKEYSTADIIPVTYTVPAFGVIFSKIVAHIFDMESVSTVYMLYFARIFSLIFAVIITALAIKKTPIMKKTFLVVALLPMNLFLYSMVSYDNILIPLSLLGLSIILDITFNKNKIDKKDIITLSLIGTILLNVKIIYFFMYILMFAIPVKKFGVKKDKIKSCLKILGIILLLTLIFRLPLLVQKGVNSDTSAKEQLLFIISHPFKYIAILYIDIVERRPFYFSTTVGTFGLVDTFLPVSLVSIIYINLFVIAISDEVTDKIKVSKLFKKLSIIYIIFSILSIFSALYIWWTPKIINIIGGTFIIGVQGRYFIPLVMPFLLLFSNNKIKDNKMFKIVRENYLLMPIIFLLVSLSMILFRFWV